MVTVTARDLANQPMHPQALQQTAHLCAAAARQPRPQLAVRHAPQWKLSAGDRLQHPLVLLLEKVKPAVVARRLTHRPHQLAQPPALPVLLVCAVLTYVILHSTKLGRYTYAIGSNKAAAIYAGIPVAGYTIAVYAISGMLTGVSSMIEASRLMTGQPTAGQGYELLVIAAVVIGGGSLSGGEGSVVGTLIGTFIMGLLANGSDLLGINLYVRQAIIGAVIIIAVALDEARKWRFTG